MVSVRRFGRAHDGLGFAPLTIQHGHGSTAISGIVYLSDPSWPDEYQDNVFIGNVMTSRVNRDRIEAQFRPVLRSLRDA